MIKKKGNWMQFSNISFFVLLKIGSVGPVDQQINLVSPFYTPLLMLGISVLQTDSKELKLFTRRSQGSSCSI